MRRDEPSPIYKVCNDCTTHIKLSPEDAGRLLSRHYGLISVSDVSSEQIHNKLGDPSGWMNHVEDSIVKAQMINDPLALTTGENGLEIINGNHRAWVAHRHGIPARATVFMPVCGRCTEALFEDCMNTWTRAIGWMHHQQGF